MNRNQRQGAATLLKAFISEGSRAKAFFYEEMRQMKKGSPGKMRIILEDQGKDFL